MKSLIYSKKFRLRIENSSLESLAFNNPFVETNYFSIEFVDCYFGNWISTNAFVNTNIDLMLIKSPKQNSKSPFFRRSTLFGYINVKALKIHEAFDIFRKNSLTNSFGIDQLLLNTYLFKELEELEIKNTFVDFIDSNTLSQFNNLKLIRLENVYLKNVIENYFVDLSLIIQTKNESFVDFTDKSINWLSNEKIERVYLGRER